MSSSNTRPLAILCLGALSLTAAFPQGKPAPKLADGDRANAYYNFAMGHLYSELAGAYGNRGDYFSKAIDFYKQALKLDPSATFLVEEITDLYVQAGRIREAVTEAEDVLKQSPDNVEARRILGRIYSRLIGDPQQNRINEDMVKRAIEQYQKVTAQDTKDLESWLQLGRLYRVSRQSAEAEKAFAKALELDADSEEALSGQAMIYADLGDTPRAIERLSRVVEKSPDPRNLVTLAGLYEQARDFENAAKTWRRAVDANPDNMQIKRYLAQSLLYSDKLDEALKLYQEVVEAEPRDGQAHLRIAEIYRQKRKFEEARASLTRAAELDRDSLDVKYAEVNLLETEGKVAQAISGLKSIVDATSKKNYTAAEKNNRMMFLERLGFLYRQANQPAAAVETFRQMAELDPDSAPRSAVLVIDALRGGKDLAKAAEEAESARRKFPKDRSVQISYASTLADQGKTDQAIAQLQKLLGGERERETHLAIAQLYEKAKRYSEAEAALAAAEKLSQNRSEKETVQFMRGAMFEKAKKFELAETEFRRILEANPDSPGALNYLGYMLADRNVKLEEAEKLIAKAVSLDPENGAYLDSLGWVYYRLNKLPEAEANLRRALERVTGDPTVHDHLGDVYAKQGKLKEAVAQWQRSLKEYESTPKADVDALEVARVAKKLENARVRLAKEGGAEPKQ